MLPVAPGMTGATGNIYAGLHDFEEMSFVAHLLRENDLFVDVGANVGSYTLLACAAARARCITLEPLPSTFACLQQNLRLNGLESRVDARNIGAGAERGVLRFTDKLGCCNRVLLAGETGGIEVPVLPLDEVVGEERAVMLKI